MKWLNKLVLPGISLVLALALAACGGGTTEQDHNGRMTRLSTSDMGDSVNLTDEQALQYVASYPDLIAAFGTNVESAKRHFANVGRFEGRVASFNALAYIASYPDLINAFGVDASAATRHYIAAGFGEGRKISFDASVYVASSPDLILAFGLDADAATRHYIASGQLEGRPFDFDALKYIASHSDLIVAFGTNVLSATKHYITNGYYEGRQYGFDTLAYIAGYADLIGAFGTDVASATVHYIRNGFNEGRTILFNSAQYLLNYIDLQVAFGDDQTAATWHYITNGHAEGRTDKEPTTRVTASVDPRVPPVIVRSIKTISGVDSEVAFYGNPVEVAVSDALPMMLATSESNSIILGTVEFDSRSLDAGTTAVTLVRLMAPPAAGITERQFNSMVRANALFADLVSAITSALERGVPPSDDGGTISLVAKIAGAISLETSSSKQTASAPQAILENPLRGDFPFETILSPFGQVAITGGLIDVHNSTPVAWSASTSTLAGEKLGKRVLKGASLTDWLEASFFNGSVWTRFLAPKGETLPVPNNTVPFQITIAQDTEAFRQNTKEFTKEMLQMATLGVVNAVAPSCIEAIAGAIVDKLFEDEPDQNLSRFVFNFKTFVEVRSGLLGGSGRKSSIADGFCPVNAAKIGKTAAVLKFLTGSLQTSFTVGQAALMSARMYWVFDNKGKGETFSVCLGDDLGGRKIVNCAAKFENLDENFSVLVGASYEPRMVALDADGKRTLRPASTKFFTSSPAVELLNEQTGLVRAKSNAPSVRLDVYDPLTGAIGATEFSTEFGVVSPLVANIPLGQSLQLVVGAKNPNMRLVTEGVSFSWNVLDPKVASLSPSLLYPTRSVMAKAESSGSTFVVAKNSVTKDDLLSSIEVPAVDTNVHWTGRYNLTTAEVSGPIYPYRYFFENPTYSVGPVSGGYQGFFHFSSGSAPIILGASLGRGENVRNVYSQAWVDKADEFTISIPIGYESFRGTRTTTFFVTSRSPTSMSGTVRVETMSGVSLSNGENNFFPATARGTWTASLVRSPLPMLDMRGYDFCFSDNSAAKQMDIGILPSWVGQIANACKFQ